MTIKCDIALKLNSYNLNIKFQSKYNRIGILGYSGSGKSMLLKSFAGIVTPNSGYITINDKEIFNSNKKINLKIQERKIGYLFQNSALFPHLTVLENLYLVGKPHLIPDIIKSCKLDNLLNSYPHEISGGEKQLVALGRILSVEPDVILLDEPFSALDKNIKEKMQINLFKILENFKGTIILVSHDSDEIYKLCDEVIVISKGRIQEIGDKEKIFHNFDSFSTAILLGYSNGFPLYPKDNMLSLETLNLDIENSKNLNYNYACIKKEDIFFDDSSSIEGEVKTIISLPYGYLYLLNVNGVEVKCMSLEKKFLNEKVRISLKKDKIKLVVKGPDLV